MDRNGWQMMTGKGQRARLQFGLLLAVFSLCSLEAGKRKSSVVDPEIEAFKRKRSDIDQEIGVPKRKRTAVDKVLAIIYHTEGSTIILQSDLRPDLSDQVPSLREAILKELILLDAKKYKITVSEAEVDRHLARIQESLKKTREDLEEFFKERGFTFEEARRELEKGLLIETTVSERVRSKAFVPESEVKKYYEEHPIVDYTVKQAFIPFGFGSRSLVRATVDRQIEEGDIITAVEWGEPLALKESDIAEEKAFLKELALGSVARVQETDDGITLLQLISKSKKPYESLKKQITIELGNKRQKQALDDYYDNLFACARVRYLTAAA